jgi:hypothetical protein
MVGYFSLKPLASIASTLDQNDLPTSPAAHRSVFAERCTPLTGIVVVARFVSPTAPKSATRSSQGRVGGGTVESRGRPVRPGCCARDASG